MKNNKNMKGFAAGSLILSALLCGTTTAMAQDQDSEVDTVAPKKIHVLFRDKDESDILGGVAAIDYLDLQTKNHGFVSASAMANTGNMWGFSGLVLVDGLPANNNVIYTDIESVTYLKGAQAVALYGSRGVNGVTLVTTKRGKSESINIIGTVNSGFHFDKQYPELLGSAEYMMWYNQAKKNDGAGEQYSPEDIYKAASGEYPYLYPNVDYYSDEYIKNFYNSTDASVIIEGGSDRTTFYTDIYYAYDGDRFKFGEAKNNNSNRLSIRGNVDIKFNDYITATVDANVNMHDSKRYRGSDYWSYAASSDGRANRIAPLIPVDAISPVAVDALEMMKKNDNLIDGKYFLSGTQQTSSNVFADIYSKGKEKNTERQFQFNTQLHFNLAPLLSGLSFHTQYGMEYANTYQTFFQNNYAVYIPEWADLGNGPVIISLKQEGENRKFGSQNITGGTTRRMYAFNAHLDYDKKFGDHSVGGMVLVNGYQQAQGGRYHKTSNADLSFNLSYDFGKRYFLDATLAIPHSAKLAEGHRNGLSKSASLGWNITNEDFFPKGGLVNNLMVSVSASDLCEDIDFPSNYGKEGYYIYAGTWNTSSTWYGWNEGDPAQAPCSVLGSNVDLEFMHRKEISANLRLSMLDNSLTFDVSAFSAKQTGGIITPTLMPIYFKSYYPNASYSSYVNYNDNSFKGIDFGVNYKKQFGEITVGVGLYGATMVAKAEKRDETDLPEFEDDKNGNQVSTAYRKREGKYLDGVWGYKTAGIFQTEDEINEYKKNIEYKIGGGSDIRPGDIIYVDQNNDGIIDDKDRVELGRAGWYGSPLSLGMNLTVGYKNFTLFVVGTGNFGALSMKNNEYIWVNGEEQYTATVRDTWTPENPNAKYPRLTTKSGATNNFQDSDFWMFKNNVFYLSKVQLSYDFPSTMFEGNRFVKGCSVYFFGTDLLTISKEREYLDTRYGSAPYTRFYNLGVKVTF